MTYHLDNTKLIFSLSKTFLQYSKVLNLENKSALEIGTGVGLKKYTISKVF
jgi:hypothetical protein